MWLATFPNFHPVWFWLIAISWSAFQGYTGWVYGLFIAQSNASASRVARALAYGAHHAAFYVLCASAGFGAWALASHTSTRIYDWSSIAGGTAALLVALGAFAVAGVSGALPRILYLGNRVA